MSRPCFRVKLDLCKYYDGDRRYCWIFIDGSRILQISHVKEHITKLFNIRQPFNLLLNYNGFLPPSEDVRIIKENEIIVVSPESEVENQADLLVNRAVTTTDQNEVTGSENNCVSTHHKEAQVNDISVTKLETQSFSQPAQQNNVSKNALSDVSMADMTFHSIIEESEFDSTNESKATDYNMTEDISMIEKPKRKRTRRRKPKIEAPLVINNNSNDTSNPKKPKIIDTCIISSGKHIRFGTPDKEDNAVPQHIVRNIPMNKCSSKELHTLLSLRNSSTPLTFINKKVKEEVKVEHISDDDSRMSMCSDRTNKSSVHTSVCKVEHNGEPQTEKQFLNTDIQSYPVMTEKPQVKDTIAFKMLKIAADYTPQVSEFIVAEVVAYSANTSMYTLKVLQGITEIQVPIGKFTLSEDEVECVINDTITVNFAQIMEPRLVSKT